MDLDSSYGALVASLPPGLQILCADLPFKIGLTATPGGSWGDYVHHAPFRDLPRFAAEGIDLGEAAVASFSRAHHLLGFFGLLLDRALDGQTAETELLAELLPHFHAAAMRALAEAAGAPLAHLVLSQSLAASREASARERAALCRRALSFDDYHAIIRLKTRWLAGPAVCLLQRSGAHDRLGAFSLAFDLLITGAQYLDDVADMEEDAQAFGLGFPEALGVEPRVLLAAAPQLLAAAARTAARGGFHTLSTWADEHAAAIRARLPRAAPRDELAAAVLTTSLGEG